MPCDGALISRARSVKGIIPSSMLDWEGKVAAVLFTGGCNLRCPFCHNAELVLEPENLDDLPWDEILANLENKKGWLDGVCLTGGEPTLNPHLKEMAKDIKDRGFMVKLDTNGTRPHALSRLVEDRLVDYVAMDIKTDFDHYHLAAGVAGVEKSIRRSIEMLAKAEKQGLEIEFRTTVVPGYAGPDDVRAIARYLKSAGARRYTLQRYNPEHLLDPAKCIKESYPRDALVELAEECSSWVPTKLR